MARLKAENLRNMTEIEIEQTINNLNVALFKLRNDATRGRIDKPHSIRESKRNIARCYTIMREKKSGK